MPWCEYPSCRCGDKVPVLWPRTANDSEVHTGMVLKFLQIGDQLELVEAWRISGGCNEVMDKDTVAAPFELLCQKQSRGLLGDIRVRLVGDPQYANAVARLDHLQYFFDQLLLGLLIHPIRSLSQRGFQAYLPGRVSQETVVARETWATITQTGAQVFLANPAVAADSFEDGIDVSTRIALSNQTQLIGEAYFHGDVAVQRNLRQFCADNRHAGDPR